MTVVTLERPASAAGHQKVLAQPGGGLTRPCAERRRRIRAALINRDGAFCFYCGVAFGERTRATIDHLVPQSQIPGWKLANLVLACYPCNQAKADQLPQVFLLRQGWRRPKPWRERGARLLRALLRSLGLAPVRECR
ncbi:HNH endonuclease signature motif containing protein [Nonomuraea sp. NPDC050202]|uniref:HNH endonuclease n=1 Tax=Nonomuraea sp. NPDC050202 TaxID=3155035 RepID=UPI0033F72062